MKSTSCRRKVARTRDPSNKGRGGAVLGQSGGVADLAATSASTSAIICSSSWRVAGRSIPASTVRSSSVGRPPCSSARTRFSYDGCGATTPGYDDLSGKGFPDRGKSWKVQLDVLAYRRVFRLDQPGSGIYIHLCTVRTHVLTFRDRFALAVDESVPLDPRLPSKFKLRPERRPW
jgi:hypothetical protein